MMIDEFVSLDDLMGTDLSVVNAARVSMRKRSQLILIDGHHVLSSRDKRLISYLARKGHWTPFAQCNVKLWFKMPIFVARQWMKHQVGFVVNEVSRRYVDDDPEFYFPESYRSKAENVKQGSGDIVDVETERDACQLVLNSVTESRAVYKKLLALDVAPEQARIVLPLSTMTEFIMNGTLFAWARLCRLRLDEHAQKETRDYAEVVSQIISKKFPVSWTALITPNTFSELKYFSFDCKFCDNSLHFGFEEKEQAHKFITEKLDWWQDVDGLWKCSNCIKSGV